MTTEQRMTFLPKILPYIVPKVKPVSDEEERKQASLDLRSIGNTAQALMFWEQQQEKEKREKAKAEAKEAAEKEKAAAQEAAKRTIEEKAIEMPGNQRQETNTAQTVEQTDRPIQTTPATANPPHQNRRTDSPSTQNNSQPQAEKQYTVTDEEYNEFMSLLCKDLEPYLKYNSLDEVDFEAIQRQKAAANAAQSNQPVR